MYKYLVTIYCSITNIIFCISSQKKNIVFITTIELY